MTKYVLQSGGAGRQPERKKKFHEELVKGLGKNPKFLLCNFAQAREYWETKFSGYTNSIAEDMPSDVIPTFELAMPTNFVEQCKNADVIYFHGGDDHLLQYWMRQFDLSELFKDKIIATNSASSDMLAASYYTCDWRNCDDGFGILPIKFIPHYKSDFGVNDPRGPIDWGDAYEQLEVYGDATLPVYALEEGDFLIVEQ